MANKTEIRYTVTGIDWRGNRVRSLENNERFNWKDKEDAEKWLEGAVEANHPDKLAVLGKSLKVLPTECYLNGDAISNYVSLGKINIVG